jgi:prefoldin subunit 5
MRGWLTLCVAVVAAAGLVGALGLRVPWDSVATTALVLACLGWLVVVLTLPWNLHFEAKALLFEMQRARERGIAVRGDREEEARRVQRRMLRVSVALHVGSALVAAGATAVMRGRWGYAFAGAYLLSGFFRPGVEYYRYLRQRLGHLAAEVTFPRHDVKALEAEVARLRQLAEQTAKAEATLRERLGHAESAAEARHRDLEKRFASLTRTFEETLNRLTDNQQIIGGIKALLRLIQQGGEAESA